MDRIFPIAAFILGISGVVLSFNESKGNIDSKVISDSALAVSKQKYDSLENIQLNLLGGGKIKPMFKFYQINPTQFIFFMMDTSKYTMRDFSITITDQEALKSFNKKVDQTIRDTIAKNNYLASIMMTNSGSYQQFVSIPFLTSYTYRNIQTINVADKKYLHYSVDMFYTGGSITYYIYCTRMSDGWRKDSIKLYDRLSGNTTFE